MVYEWGTPVTPITSTEVTGDYVGKVGDIVKYWCKKRYSRDEEMGILEFEQKSALAIADKIREDGQEPYYVKSEVIDLQYYYPKWIYDVEITVNMKILKASPITWATLIDAIIVVILLVLILSILYTYAEKFWKLVTQVGEAIGSALGLPAGAGTGLLVIGAIIVVILIVILLITRR